MALEKAGYPDLEAAIATETARKGLVAHPPWTLKLIQVRRSEPPGGRGGNGGSARCEMCEAVCHQSSGIDK